MAPKRAFGGVLRPFGGGFRGPNRERASVFSGAGRGGAGGSAVEPGGGASAFSGGARCGTGAEQAGVLRRRRGRGQRVQRRGIGAGRGVQRCRRDGRRVAKKVFRREDAPAARTQKKCSEGKVRRRPNTYGHKKNGPRSVHFYFCYTTGFCSGMLVRYTLPHDNGSALREPVSFAGDFRQHVLLQQPVCLRFRSARRSGVTAVKASAIRSLSRSAARRSGLSRLAAGISAVRVAPRESLRPPPGSQFSAARVTVLSRRGHSSQPSGVSAVRSPELAVPAARPLRRRGHSTTTSVWPSTCSWRISCVELT